MSTFFAKFLNAFKKNKSKDTEDVFQLNCIKEKEVTYKEANGLFLYDNEVFYKNKNAGGKSIKSGISFTDYVLGKKLNVPLTTKDISNLTVVQLLIK